MTDLHAWDREAAIIRAARDRQVLRRRRREQRLVRRGRLAARIAEVRVSSSAAVARLFVAHLEHRLRKAR